MQTEHYLYLGKFPGSSQRPVEYGVISSCRYILISAAKRRRLVSYIVPASSSPSTFHSSIQEGVLVPSIVVVLVVYSGRTIKLPYCL